MYKIGLCGYYAKDINDHGGQSVKTRIIVSELSRIFGENMIKIVDTKNWKRNIVKLFFKFIHLSMSCNNIIIMPASNGIKIMVPLYLFLNMIYKRKLIYIVIGGWLPEVLEENSKLKRLVSKYDAVYVETRIMSSKLKEIGLNNVHYLPNFKRLNIVKNVIINKKKPFKLCTFSRVSREKGIEDAIEAVINANRELREITYRLDIYGQVDQGYKEYFFEKQKNFPEYISYKGIIPYNDCVDILKNYFALLFLTFYEGEGFPGTIIDSYASGLPIIASDWHYNSEIVKDGQCGRIVPVNDIDATSKILVYYANHPDEISSMSENCIQEAYQYTPDIVMREMVEALN